MSDTLPASTRILVIDDDEDLLFLLNKMLLRIGVSPAMAQNASEGLRLLAEADYDLLILDLMLPDMDGFEVLRRIRQDTRYDRMPVLILSALADPDTISSGLELGADGYLTKPYLPNTLINRVRSALFNGRAQPDNPAY